MVAVTSLPARHTPLSWRMSQPRCGLRRGWCGRPSRLVWTAMITASMERTISTPGCSRVVEDAGGRRRVVVGRERPNGLQTSHLVRVSCVSDSGPPVRSARSSPPGGRDRCAMTRFVIGYKTSEHSGSPKNPSGGGSLRDCSDCEQREQHGDRIRRLLLNRAYVDQ